MKHILFIALMTLGLTTVSCSHYGKKGCDGKSKAECSTEKKSCCKKKDGECKMKAMENCKCKKGECKGDSKCPDKEKCKKGECDMKNDAKKEVKKEAKAVKKK